MTILN
jgi:hypothetical protein